jgi:hypothetical protein
MMDRPTCKTCPYYDTTATMVIYPPPVAGQQAGAIPMTAIEVRGICRRHPPGGGHKRPEEWCGEHPDMPAWITASRPATPTPCPSLSREDLGRITWQDYVRWRLQQPWE